MKTALTFALFALVASMIAAPAFADSKLDSFVNLATQARTQVKAQLDKMPSTSDDVKSSYAQGDSETEQLIAAVKKGDATEAKKHFLAAMKAFRDVTQAFSEPVTQVSKVTAPSMATRVATPPATSDFDYGNALKRYETNIGILKAVAAKNNLQVDFSKIDNLLQITKSNLANGDVIALNKTFTDLKAAGIDLQATIKNMVTDQSNKRAVSFANKYVSKIDAVLAQAKDLNLSEDQIDRLQQAKEELASGGDSSQVVIKIKRVYQINLDLLDAKNQKILSEISKQDSRLSLLEPKIDDTIRPKFDAAKSMLVSLKDPTNTDDPIKQLRVLDSTIKDIEAYLLSQTPQSTPQPTTNTQPADQKSPDQTSAPKETPKPQTPQPTEPQKPQPEIKSEQKQDKQQEKQDRKKDQGKAQRISPEIAKIDAKLAELEPQIDDTIQPKFDAAKAMLAKLKETGPDKKTIRAINSLIDEITQYLDSQDSGN